MVKISGSISKFVVGGELFWCHSLSKLSGVVEVEALIEIPNRD